MIPSSTNRGKSVAAFPDVCTTPTPGGPTPVSYPNLARGTQTASKVTAVQNSTQLAPKGSVFSSVGDQVQSKGLTSAVNLRGQLSQLHGRLASLSGTDPNQWHALIDEYVQVTAQLYVTLASSKKTDP
jgi:hypothetical protein